jgi:hypothetical protein
MRCWPSSKATPRRSWPISKARPKGSKSDRVGPESFPLTTEAVIHANSGTEPGRGDGGMGAGMYREVQSLKCKAPVSLWTARVQSQEGIR